MLKTAKDYSTQVTYKIWNMSLFIMASQRIHCIRFIMKHVQNIGTLILSLK